MDLGYGSILAALDCAECVAPGLDRSVQQEMSRGCGTRSVRTDRAGPLDISEAKKY